MLFASISERTGWTPAEISKLSIDQLNAYIESWSGKSESGKGTMVDMDGKTRQIDVSLFNMLNDIKVVKKNNQ